jgi:hypothetical protein
MSGWGVSVFVCSVFYPWFDLWMFLYERRLADDQVQDIPAGQILPSDSTDSERQGAEVGARLA